MTKSCFVTTSIFPAFWEYHDRGMGRLSLSLHGSNKTLEMGVDGTLSTTSVHKSSLSLSLSLSLTHTHTHTLHNLHFNFNSFQGMGSIEPTDFRVLECPTGELLLENTVHSGQYVTIWSSKYRIRVKELSIYLLVKIYYAH